MKLTLLSKLLLPSSLLLFGTASAYAGAVDCSSILTLADAIASNSNTTPGCAVGNVVFSDFTYDFSNGTGDPPVTSANYSFPNGASIGFSLTTDGLGDYTVAADFSCYTPGDASCSSGTPFSVNDSQNLTLQLQYVITEQAPLTTLTYADGGGNEGVAHSDGSTASGDIINNVCAGSAFGAYTNAVLGSPAVGSCSNNTSVADLVWGQDQASGDPTTQAGQSQAGLGSPGSSADVSPDATLPAGVTSFGVYDQADISGGTGGTGSGAQAAVGLVGNDFSETGSAIPEPSTCLLLGGALVALGAIRRKKSV